jgi:hypothetical protein
MSSHLVLLGDSILDNAAYVPGRRPAVIDVVRNRLPDGWHATLLAVDGSVINDVYRQLDALPDDATQLVLSAGGNDALSEAGALRETVKTVGQGLRLIADVCDRFEGDPRIPVSCARAEGRLHRGRGLRRADRAIPSGRGQDRGGDLPVLCRP